MKKSIFIALLGVIVNTVNAQSIFPTDGSNVGIGTTSPAYSLDINKSTASLNLNGSGFGNSGASINLLGWAASSKNWQIGVANIGYDGLMFSSSTSIGGATFTTPAMLINSNGNVGIGTVTPSAKLSLVGTTTLTPFTSQIGGAGIWQFGQNVGAGSNDDTFGFYSTTFGPGHSYAPILQMNSANGNVLLAPNSGNVGIGTATPAGGLQIHNNVGYIDNSNNQLVLSNSGYRNSESGTLNPDNAGMAFYFTNYESGVKHYDRTLDIRVRGASDGTFGAGMIRFFANDYTSGSVEREIMRIHGNGNVGIGTTDPGIYKLAVNGTIHSKAVIIDLIGWPDYVFKKDYQLMPLAQVKSYIDQNQHLPGLPSDKEVEGKGLDVGEMNKLLSKKVEELTLYLIEKDKEINEQKETNKQQQATNQCLEQKFNKLAAQLNELSKQQH